MPMTTMCLAITLVSMSGSLALPNEGDGIYIYSSGESPATTGNEIGGNISAEKRHFWQH